MRNAVKENIKCRIIVHKCTVDFLFFYYDVLRLNFEMRM